MPLGSGQFTPASAAFQESQSLLSLVYYDTRRWRSSCAFGAIIGIAYRTEGVFTDQYLFSALRPEYLVEGKSAKDLK